MKRDHYLEESQAFIKSLFLFMRYQVNKIKNYFKDNNLQYLEFQITDSCNFSCKGCAHFCPVAERWFVNMVDYERDVYNISRLIKNIGVIRILGGEPLLHPQIIQILESTRKYYKLSNIVLVTNGSLLNEMEINFWESCKKLNITIFISMHVANYDFTPILKNIEKYRLDFVCCTFWKYNKILSLQKRSNKYISQANCRKNYFIPLVKNGRLFFCPKPANIKHLNNKFKLAFPQDDYLALNDKNLTNAKIINFINKPGNLCSNCNNYFTSFDYEEFSKMEITEWVS